MVFAKKIFSDRKWHISKYSGTSPYGHLTSKKTSPLQSPWLSPKLYSTVQITPCNKVTSALRSLLPSPVGDLNSEVPLYRSLFWTNIKLQFVNSKKILPVGIFFLRIPSPRILRQVGQGQISRSWYFFYAIYPAAGHKLKSTGWFYG